MREYEAMWIEFRVNLSSDKLSPPAYAVRINLGEINCISGKSIFDKTSKEQDYVILPEQKWIDGILVQPGVVRQFVAVPSMLYPNCCFNSGIG